MQAADGKMRMTDVADTELFFLCHPERSEGSRMYKSLFTDPSTSSG